MKNFKRGYVCWTNIPKSVHTTDTPKPGFFLEGKHLSIVLHDHDSPEIRKNVAMIVPITSAKAEVRSAEKEGRAILASYVPISNENHTFLSDLSYVSTSQMIPVNREWMEEYIDKVDPDVMQLIDFQIVQNIGLMNLVMGLANEMYEEKIQLLMEEAAATNEI